VLDDAGHALPHEQLELLSALVAAWLALVERDSRSARLDRSSSESG
jgi:hypothetical protein